MRLDPVLSLALTMHASKGVYALLLGSGVSRPAAIPTGWEVVLDLVRKLAKVDGEDCEPDPAVWFARKYGQEPDYAKLLDVLGTTPELRQQLLRAYFEPSDDEREQSLKRPTRAHRAIGRLVAQGHVRVILTTNFDRLTERAIEDEGVTPVVVSTPEGLAGCLPLVHQRCTVIKLHGDYLDTRVKNTPAELAAYEPSTDRMLDRVFDEYGVIVAGWSGEWDAALRAAMERCPTRRFGFYWTSVVEPRDTAKRLAALRGGSVIRVSDADQFFEELATKVGVLEEATVDHPVNMLTAVTLVKRYSADPQHRIRLHDLLMHEADVAFAESEPLLQAWRGDRGRTDHRPFLEAAAGSVAKLRQMLGHAAHWGGEEVVPMIIKCVAKLAQETLPQGASGTLRGEWFRTYLGGMALYGAGLGFITAGRFVAAARMLEEAYADGHQRRERFLVEFTRHLHELSDLFNSGQETRLHVPFSELMLKYLREELGALASSPAAFETAFDEWELLMAMVYGDLDNVKVDQQRGGWLTLGRYIYGLRYGHRSELFPPPREADTLELCKAQQPFRELIETGFFSGRWERVLELRAIVLNVASHHRWS
jgi:hypothetical protein